MREFKVREFKVQEFKVLEFKVLSAGVQSAGVNEKVKHAMNFPQISLLILNLHNLRNLRENYSA